MEVATGEYGDNVWKLKKAIDCLDDLDDSSLVDESIFDGRQEIGLQASTLCLLQEKVDKRPSLLKVRPGSFVCATKKNCSGNIVLSQT